MDLQRNIILKVSGLPELVLPALGNGFPDEEMHDRMGDVRPRRMMHQGVLHFRWEKIKFTSIVE